MNTTASLLLRGEHPAPFYVAQLSETLPRKGWLLATAESCTGGLIAGACTERPGSSTWLDRGFVSYSNQAKTAMLGVPADMVMEYGAVSEPVARAMAQGACAHSLAHVSLAVTGVAGPDGGTAAKPVGTVWFGWQVAGQTFSECMHFEGDRAAIRQATVVHALKRLLEHISTCG